MTHSLIVPSLQQQPDVIAEPNNMIDLLLLCHAENAKNLLEIFARKIEAAQGTLPLQAIAYGSSRLLRQGLVFLRWQGTDIPPLFLLSLSHHYEIWDYVLRPRLSTPEMQRQCQGQTEMLFFCHEENAERRAERWSFQKAQEEGAFPLYATGYGRSSMQGQGVVYCTWQHGEVSPILHTFLQHDPEISDYFCQRDALVDSHDPNALERHRR
jgi:hypothetical protein